MNTEGMGREHLIEFEPAYDKRPKKKGDPDYGIHGVTMRWIVKGEAMSHPACPGCTAERLLKGSQ